MKNLGQKIVLLGAVLLLLLATAVLSISYISSGKLISPPREAIGVTPKNLGMSYNEIEFLTSDQLKIRGWFIPASRRTNPDGRFTIILAHGYTHNRAQMNDYLKFLHQRGFNVLSFDFRGHGESEGTFTTLGQNETKDIDGAVDWLKRNHPAEARKIGILGISMGGATAIEAAAHNPAIDAVVSDSAFARLSNAVDSSFSEFAHLPAFPFSPITLIFAQMRTHTEISRTAPVELIASISPRPVFIIHSKFDHTILYQKNAIPLYEAAREPKILWIVEGGDHVRDLEFARSEYEGAVDRFFETALKYDLR